MWFPINYIGKSSKSSKTSKNSKGSKSSKSSSSSSSSISSSSISSSSSIGTTTRQRSHWKQWDHRHREARLRDNVSQRGHGR